MSAPLRVLFMTITVIAAALSALRLAHDYRSNPLLGFWDSGRFSKEQWPQPVPLPDDQMAKLTSAHRISLSASKEGNDLLQVFKWYGLDESYLRATVKANSLGDDRTIPSYPIDIVLDSDR
jgi:hypothetical protein